MQTKSKSCQECLTPLARIAVPLLRLLRNQNGKTLSIHDCSVNFALAVSAASTVNAQSIVYNVDHEWAQIFINPDGTIDLTYNITVTVTQGIMHGFDVGQPNRDFTPGQA